MINNNFVTTQFKGVQNIGDSQLISQLENNLVSFFDWSMLCIGGFYNVYRTNINTYGGAPWNMKLSDDRRYPKGQVWDGFRTNWVWESNVLYPVQPIQISGIYVNNNFYPTGVNDPTYGYNINYPLGRVIFNNPIPATSTVQVEYSYRAWNCYNSSIQWFRDFNQRLSRMDDYQYNWYGSGVWSIFSDSRVSMPAIVVEGVPGPKYKPYQLGGGQWANMDVLFHIFAETPSARNNMINILQAQQERTILLYDENQMMASGGAGFPLNINGGLVNPNNIYPNLVNNYLWRYGFIWWATSQKVTNEPPSLYLGNVRWNLDLEFAEY